MWNDVECRATEIRDFLSSGIITYDTSRLGLGCLRIVLGEILTNKTKYPTKILKEEDFVDMLIESIATELPDIKDVEGNIKYIEEFRTDLWGHIRSHKKDLTNIYLRSRDLTIDDFRECMMVVVVEISLREREKQVGI